MAQAEREPIDQDPSQDQATQDDQTVQAEAQRSGDAALRAGDGQPEKPGPDLSPRTIHIGS